MGSETKISKAERFIQNLNVINAKKLALLMVIGFIIYHGLLHLRYGSDSCKWLLSDGRFKGNKEWQPFGCMLHKYTETDTRKCFRYLAFWGNQNHFVFIGDVRIRTLYLEMINHLKPADADNASIQSILGKTENLQFVDYKLRLQINYIYANEVSRSVVDEFIKWQHEEDPPILIVASCTYSTIHKVNVSKELLKAFERNLTTLVKPIDDLMSKKSKVIWKLQDPIYHDHSMDEWTYVQNEDIDKINQVVYNILSYSSAKIWSSSKMIASGLADEFVDGHKLDRLALKHDVQILLNMYCNDYMNYNDGTCCSSAEPYTIIQIITYAILGVCLAIAAAMIIRRCLLKLRGVNFYMPLSQTAASPAPSSADSQSPVLALASLTIIMSYFYICDRTNFFMKENKYYSEFSFWIPVGYVFVVGLFFTEDKECSLHLHSAAIHGVFH
ncbi:N-acetylneuraminate 9-O-acetyltransferase isoform X2 [Toxorhynchites rutilus septentrionalis]|uniref:N-acetylneuraminate 9-O-acetyltransferase isoform X2 n=1 Tax=Toxorhynchites rutilus septentrionalis TaxID=329112 RepID=UPI002478343D|nr:N-acetylneuraminate 9-O-acetyltransferase isoform X2 [Toxorhynchites rutilus septentrionalis]